MRLLFHLLIAALLLNSCSSGTDQKQDAAEKKDSVPAKENFKTGEILDITNSRDATQTYVLYLPKAYATASTYPAFFILDAHAEGKLPIEKYQILSDKYNCILIAANNSRNGLAFEESQAIVDKLIADARSRLSLDENRIYLMGFSGGARVANAITKTNGAIAGLICCGAATPAKTVFGGRKNYFLMTIAGKRDFNYVEMRKYDLVDIGGDNLKHYQLIFDGKHEWPPLETMDEAFWWMEMNQARKDKSVKEKWLPQINSLVSKEKAKLKTIQKDPAALLKLCKKTINYYEQLTDLKEFYDTYKSLQGDPQADKSLKREEEIWQQEDQLKAFYMAAIKEKDLQWWKQNIRELNGKINADKVKDETEMYQRTLGYLSLVCYLQSTGMLQQNNAAGAAYFIELYVLVDPTNSEAHYLMADICASKGDTKGALQSLRKSVENGFKDLERIKSDTNFGNIASLKEFQEILKEIEEKK
jgi:dienelactone hydrolase